MATFSWRVEVIRSGENWALAHFSRFMKRGARRLESQGDVAGLGHFADKNPGGQKVLVLTNTGSTRTVENSITTLAWD